ncbi:MAG: hypothetical protein WC220_15240, partial [Pedobacter sp.]
KDMRKLLPFLEEEDRIWNVLNTDISIIDVKKLEQTLEETEKSHEETKNSVRELEIKKHQAEIRTIKDLIWYKNETTETVKRLVKDIYQLQLDAGRILNQAYEHFLEIWNGSLRENCPLPLNRSQKAISDIKNGNIEQLISEIEDLLQHAEVKLKKPLVGRETDKDSLFNDIHKRTNTLSLPMTKDEEIVVKDPVKLYLKLQQKRVYLLDGFNKVLGSVIYNAVGNEGIKQCERYESDYEKGSNKWKDSKLLLVPFQVNDNNIAMVAKWIYKYIQKFTSTELLPRRISFFDTLFTRASAFSLPITPLGTKSASSTQSELVEIKKLENDIALIAAELMSSQLPLNQKEREKYLELSKKFDSLVKLKPVYEIVQKDIRNLLAPPETKSKVIEESKKEKSGMENDPNHDIKHSF